MLTTSEESVTPDIQNYEPLYISGFVGNYFQEERMFPATLEVKKTKKEGGDYPAV